MGIVIGKAVKKLSGKRDGDTERLGGSGGVAGAAAFNSEDRASHAFKLEVHCCAKGSISAIAVSYDVER